MLLKSRFLLILLALSGGYISHLRSSSAEGYGGPQGGWTAESPQAQLTVTSYTPSGVPTSVQTPAMDQGGASGQANTLLPSDVTTLADTFADGDGTPSPTATPTNDPNKNAATSDKVSKSSDISFTLALKVAAEDVANLLCSALPGLCSDASPKNGTPTDSAAKKSNGTKPKPITAGGPPLPLGKPAPKGL